MAEYSTPGVYYEVADTAAPAIGPVRMDVAGFVGIAARGPLDTPVPVESWRQFTAHFGGFSGSAFLAYSVRAFFENGGRRCWVVRVASKDLAAGAAPAAVTVPARSGAGGWVLSASSPGSWGDELAVRVVEVHRAQTASVASDSEPVAATVLGTSGFERAGMVRLTQEPHPPQFKVVSEVDPLVSVLHWVNPDPRARLAWESPLTGFDVDRPVFVDSVEYTVLVWHRGRLIERHDHLAPVPEHHRYGPRRLAPWRAPEETAVRDALPTPPHALTIREADDHTDPLDALDLAGAAPHPLAGGRDGLAALGVEDFLGREVDPRASDAARRHWRRGLTALGEVREIGLVAIPDIHVRPVQPPLLAPPEPCIADPCLPTDYLPPAEPHRWAIPEVPPTFEDEQVYRVQAALVDHCERRRDRIALLTPPWSASRDDELGRAAATAWRSRFDSDFAALFYPWVRVVDPLRESRGETRTIPVVGHVAGQYADKDFEVGVHAAAANRPLAWAQDVTVAVSPAAHGPLNDLGVNVLRAVPGRGLRVLGARTLSSDPDWRFVNVRRLVCAVRKSVDLATQWAAFEPNDRFTRAKLRLALTSFLLTLWQRGALMGPTAEAAFFVKCDETNNPPHERRAGRMVVDVGIAPTVPFEFVVLRVGRTGNELEIEEVRLAKGAVA